MANFDPQITKLLEERSTGYASEKTAAKELVALTGLDFNVARAFCRGWSTTTAPEIRGYRKEFVYKGKKK
jgi:hypothetical protein